MAAKTRSSDMPDKIVKYPGRFLNFVQKGSWEYVERANASDVVAIIATTPEPYPKYVLTEQFRQALGCVTIDLPAGLCGDMGKEQPIVAAVRELVEETGFGTENIRRVAKCPSSPGLTSEVLTYFQCSDAAKVADGGGAEGEGESIIVHTPQLSSIDEWLDQQIQMGKMIDPKVYLGLYFIAKNMPQQLPK